MVQKLTNYIFTERLMFLSFLEEMHWNRVLRQWLEPGHINKEISRCCFPFLFQDDTFYQSLFPKDQDIGTKGLFKFNTNWASTEKYQQAIDETFKVTTDCESFVSKQQESPIYWCHLIFAIWHTKTCSEMRQHVSLEVRTCVMVG